MHKNILSRKIILVALIVIATTLISQHAKAYKLTFYYDPDTGNVSLDTSETRTGEIISYGLRIYGATSTSKIRYYPENHIALTTSALSTVYYSIIEEVTFSNPMKGLLTLGNVLPAGLSEEKWSDLYYGDSGRANYSPGLGYPSNENIRFEYGRPDREFDNRWDLIDPNTLDWATEASLIYRQATGEILLDTRGSSGGHISGFRLESDGRFDFEKFTPPWNSLSQVADANSIILFGDAIEPGTYSLGNILEDGLTEDEFESQFSSTTFWGMAGFAGSFDLLTEGQTFSMVYIPIPEPTTASLFTLATFLLTTSRKRTSRHK